MFARIYGLDSSQCHAVQGQFTCTAVVHIACKSSLTEAYILLHLGRPHVYNVVEPSFHIDQSRAFLYNLTTQCTALFTDDGTGNSLLVSVNYTYKQNVPCTITVMVPACVETMIVLVQLETCNNSTPAERWRRLLLVLIIIATA